MKHNNYIIRIIIKQLTALTQSELNIANEIPIINIDEVIFNEASLEIKIEVNLKSFQLN